MKQDVMCEDDRFTKDWLCPKCSYLLDPFDDYFHRWECPECEWIGEDAFLSEEHQVRITWGDYGEGVSDLVVTYCCSATPCYFVVFPDGYAAYFQVKDVEVV